MVTVTTIEEYNKYYTSETPLVAMYSAAWCGPCKQMKPHFYAAAEAINNINFCVIDMDIKCLAEITSNIRSIPTTIFSFKGKSVKRMTSSMTRRELDSSIEDFKKTVHLEQASLVPSREAPLPTPQKK
jgi:thiol-disulfide isomerase/thioredoxin